MQDVLDRVSKLNRPKILVRTAKSAIKDYRRETHLTRVLGVTSVSRHSAAIHMLLDLENDHNERRINQSTTYSLTDHLDVLIALIGEVQLLSELRRTQIE